MIVLLVMNMFGTNCRRARGKQTVITDVHLSPPGDGPMDIASVQSFCWFLVKAKQLAWQK